MFVLAVKFPDNDVFLGVVFSRDGNFLGNGINAVFWRTLFSKDFDLESQYKQLRWGRLMPTCSDA